jgi:hypothetical protein
MSVAIRPRLSPSLAPLAADRLAAADRPAAAGVRAVRAASPPSHTAPPAAPAATRPGAWARFTAAVRGFFASVASTLGSACLGLVSAVQTLLGLEPAGRALREGELGELGKVFGGSVDLTRVRLKEGTAGLLTVFNRPFTLGNTIYVPKSWVPLSRESLVHEVAHVWQYQHGGTAYMAKAVWAQWFGDAYQWRKGLDQGKSWAQLDPEQQAQLISDAYAADSFDALSRRPGGRDVYAGRVEAAIGELRAGRGAP